MRGRSPPPFDRRRSPPWRDRRPMGSRDRRRSRSFSPPRRPSPTYKRFRREDDHYDRYDRRSPRRGGYDRDRYDSRDSHRGSYRRGGSRERDFPDSYKEFMLRLPDDISPEGAAKRYQEYLGSWWGSRAKADFEQKKGEQWMRDKYDPRVFSEAIERRRTHALEVALKFSEDLKSGNLDPAAKEFNQGAGPGAPKPDKARGDTGAEAKTGEKNGAGGGEAGASDTGGTDGFVGFAPAPCWRSDRVRSDLKLSRELMAKLDSERGVENNPLFVEEVSKGRLQSAEEPHADGAVNGDAEKEVEQAKEAEPEGTAKPMDTDCAPEKPGENDQEPKDDTAPAGSGPDVEAATLKAKQDESVDSELLGKLDLQLTYLWNVHYIDFYAGHELSEEEYRTAKCRMIRGPMPEAGENGLSDADQALLHELEQRIDVFWHDRIDGSDPLEAKAQTKRVEQAIEEFTEAQVYQLEDKKWGNKLSTKLFMGKEFVLKHIRLKHKPVLQAERDKILDEIYYENYKKEVEAEEQRAEEERRTEQAQRDEAADEGGDRSDGAPGRGGHMSNWNRMGGNRGGMVEAPMMAGPMMAGPMGQVLLPAPGAGPLGPFILQPVPTPPMDMGPMARQDQRRGMQYSGHVPRGGSRGGGWGGGVMMGYKDYYDLDAPQNNRAVLDYGDL
ncbi:unnamed protein product [Ostreobium quekettii]|uniref:SERRATE/Ars2 N-terminal domain-containing protein n=1 Tax=Ostreobium quekettii TaxID=121088 RepID=A0A8S1J3D6_9CHLO|nr:unnamed protein product [Ostreobium quekettii]|eukprot:evm.model.scf_1187.3 EVM.evm.TU.scf_1187.3   scf_1187:22420-30708(-)